MPIRTLLLLIALAASNAPTWGAETPLEPYTETIPGTDIAFEMIPVPGGVVRLPVGSEDGGADGGAGEFVEVELPPYWIGRTEVTWAEYQQYMALDKAYARMQQLTTLRREGAGAEELAATPRLAEKLSTDRTANAESLDVDAVTAPTPLYDPSTTYESGEDPELPAVTMTPFAARQYTKWLSALTQHDYRLPSEAEWLHAASAGGAESTPDDLDGVAWYTDNSEFVAQPVGQKTPNAWGLEDTLGNAAELVLDAFYPEGRPQLAGKRVGWAEGVAWPRKGDARIAKGGWYDAEADEVSLDARMPTADEDWKASDPNLPRSPWWFADYPATGVGFRVVRPSAPITEELRRRVWDTEDAAVARAVTERLREGRGKMGPIGSDLPEVLKELDSPAVQKLLK